MKAPQQQTKKVLCEKQRWSSGYKCDGRIESVLFFLYFSFISNHDRFQLTVMKNTIPVDISSS